MLAECIELFILLDFPRERKKRGTGVEDACSAPVVTLLFFAYVAAREVDIALDEGRYFMENQSEPSHKLPYCEPNGA